jgi:hypothetical protein
MGIRETSAGVQEPLMDVRQRRAGVRESFTDAQELRTDAKISPTGIQEPLTGVHESPADTGKPSSHVRKGLGINLLPKPPVRVATFDSGLHLDDPNFYWGDPAYLLEPGDPGYIADPTSASFPPTQPKKKTKTMPKHDLIKAKDADFAAQLLTCKNNLGAYSALLGLTADQVSAQGADADYFNQAVCCQDIADKHAQQRTAWKNIIRKGGDVPASGAPAAPTYPSAVPAVAPGVERRFRDLCGIIKTHPAHNDAMSEALGIQGDEITAPDFSTFKPEFTLELSGGQPFARWGWQGKSQFLDMLELQVDRGDGHGFVVLAYDTTPGYLDTFPIPATAQKWTYKAIFRVGDQRIGQWSNEVSITVG